MDESVSEGAKQRRETDRITTHAMDTIQRRGALRSAIRQGPAPSVVNTSSFFAPDGTQIQLHRMGDPCDDVTNVLDR